MPENKPSTDGNGYTHPLALVGSAPEMRGFSGEPILPRIHRTAKIEAFCTVDAGVDRETVIGARTWLLKHCHVGHDAIIGEDCEISVGTVICGFVQIGDAVKIGVNACVRPFVKVGDGARIGMGAVVVRDVPPGEVWAGNPARKIVEKRDALAGADTDRG